MILPKAPDNDERMLYVDQNRFLFYSSGVLCYFAFVVGTFLFAATDPTLFIFFFYWFIMSFYLGLSYMIGILGKKFNYKAHMALQRTFGKFTPTVDVYLPSCGEPLEVIENTFKHVRALNWPEGKLHVFVLDDSDRGAVARLAAKYEFTYIVRPNRGFMKKSGNLRHAFSVTESEFFVVFDADFCPRRDFLTETMPYFANNDKLAIVQTPQYFSIEEGQSWVEKGAAYFQEIFYRLIQVSRDTWAGAICTGTCAVYRRAAFVAHGGTYLIEHSEDMHTGWQALVDGWDVKYVPVNLAKGMCPDSMANYWAQQNRWCTGSTSLLFSKKFWVNRISTMQRLCYISGILYYSATALGLFGNILPGLLMAVFWPEKIHWFNYIFAIPNFMFGIGVIAMWSHAPFGLYAMTARQVAYYAHFYSLIDRFKGKVTAWVPSGNAGKGKLIRRYLDFKKMMFLWVSFSTFITVGASMYHMQKDGWYNFAPLVFFSLFNFWISMRAFSEEA